MRRARFAVVGTSFLKLSLCSLFGTPSRFPLLLRSPRLYLFIVSRSVRLGSFGAPAQSLNFCSFSSLLCRHAKKMTSQLSFGASRFAVWFFPRTRFAPVYGKYYSARSPCPAPKARGQGRSNRGSCYLYFLSCSRRSGAPALRRAPLFYSLALARSVVFWSVAPGSLISNRFRNLLYFRL